VHGIGDFGKEWASDSLWLWRKWRDKLDGFVVRRGGTL
jgi:hypothetical protein